MSKKRRKVDLKLQPLPGELLGETAACPLCGESSAAIGRLALRYVFRCERCTVVFKRVLATRLDA